MRMVWGLTDSDVSKSVEQLQLGTGSNGIGMICILV